jgi:hypothetical protein
MYRSIQDHIISPYSNILIEINHSNATANWTFLKFKCFYKAALIKFRHLKEIPTILFKIFLIQIFFLKREHKSVINSMSIVKTSAILYDNLPWDLFATLMQKFFEKNHSFLFILSFLSSRFHGIVMKLEFSKTDPRFSIFNFIHRVTNLTLFQLFKNLQLRPFMVLVIVKE